MLFPAAVSLALVAGASAQSTVSLLLPGYDAMSLVAQIVGSDATATTYSVGCAPSVSADSCILPPGFTIAEGASTMDYFMSYAGQYVSVGCKFKGDVADCSNSMSPTPTFIDSSDLVTETTITGISSYFQPVVITSGAATGAAATTAATPAATTASVTATPTGATTSSGLSTSTSSSKKASSASGAASDAQSSTSKGGVPQVTGNARWMVGGAAAALVLAAM